MTTLNTDILPVVGQVYYRYLLAKILKPLYDGFCINYFFRRKLAVRSIENDEAARSVSWEQRRCRYPDEGLPIRLPHLKPVYPKHSYSACTVQCRRDAQIEACNCSSFFMPNTKPSEQCDFDGLACLHEQFSRLTVVKAEWSKRSGLYCKCPPSCTETDIAVVSDERVADIDERGVATVEIGLAFLPTERFRRNVVRTPLDLVGMKKHFSFFFKDTDILFSFSGKRCWFVFGCEYIELRRSFLLGIFKTNRRIYQNYSN